MADQDPILTPNPDARYGELIYLDSGDLEDRYVLAIARVQETLKQLLPLSEEEERLQVARSLVITAMCALGIVDLEMDGSDVRDVYVEFQDGLDSLGAAA